MNIKTSEYDINAPAAIFHVHKYSFHMGRICFGILARTTLEMHEKLIRDDIISQWFDTFFRLFLWVFGFEMAVKQRYNDYSQRYVYIQ